MQFEGPILKPIEPVGVKRMTASKIIMALILTSLLVVQSFSEENDVPSNGQKIAGVSLSAGGMAFAVAGVTSFFLARKFWTDESKGPMTYDETIDREYRQMGGVLLGIFSVPATIAGSVAGSIGVVKLRKYYKATKMNDISFYMNTNTQKYSFGVKIKW